MTLSPCAGVSVGDAVAVWRREHWRRCRRVAASALATLSPCGGVSIGDAVPGADCTFGHAILMYGFYPMF